MHTARQYLHTPFCGCSRCRLVRAGRDRITRAARPLRRGPDLTEGDTRP
ncbi:hypothetical protein ACFUYE_05230 [Micromonospora humida]